MRRVLFAAVLLASPAFAQTAPLAPVEQGTLARDAFATGALDKNSGALTGDLWRGADAATLRSLLELAPARPASPAIGAALRRALLSPGAGPADATPALGGAKLKALVRAGFIEEAREIESLASGARTDPASSEAMATADLLTGDTDAACDRGRRLNQSGAFWVRLRVLCYAGRGELDAAELALNLLQEGGRLSAVDAALLGALASGGKASEPPVDAIHYAALKAMESPIDAAMLSEADAGVVKGVALDAAADWPTRLAAAKAVAAMGVMSAAEVRALHAVAPQEAAGAFAEIKAMTAPELLRDKARRVAAEISAATDFASLFAASVLYADDIKSFEGAIVEPREAESFALASLAEGDAGAAEKWLLAAGAGAAGALSEIGPRFAELAGLLAVLDRAAADRVAASRGVKPAAIPPAPSADSSAASLAPVVRAAIDGAENGARGASALAAIAASDAAAHGDPVAEAVVAESLAAAGLDPLARRRLVERALMAKVASATPAPAAVGATAVTPTLASGDQPAPSSNLTPRLKPQRAR